MTPKKRQNSYFAVRDRKSLSDSNAAAATALLYTHSDSNQCANMGTIIRCSSRHLLGHISREPDSTGGVQTDAGYFWLAGFRVELRTHKWGCCHAVGSRGHQMVLSNHW